MATDDAATVLYFNRVINLLHVRSMATDDAATVLYFNRVINLLHVRSMATDDAATVLYFNRIIHLLHVRSMATDDAATFIAQSDVRVEKKVYFFSFQGFSVFTLSTYNRVSNCLYVCYIYMYMYSRRKDKTLAKTSKHIN